MLDWPVRHDPAAAQSAAAEIAGAAEKRFGISREVTLASVDDALDHAWELDAEARAEFMKLVLPSE